MNNEQSQNTSSTSSGANDELRFTHQRYAAELSLVRVFTMWLSRPLGICLMPVMIVALFMALQEQQINAFLKIGTPIAVCIAAGWTALQIARTPAEVSFRNDRVLVKTFLEASQDKGQERWHHVIDVKVVYRAAIPRVTSIVYGHTAFEFRDADWTDLQVLTTRLMEAKHRYERKVKAAISS